VVAAQVVLGAAMLVFIARALYGLWGQYRAQPLHLDMRWSYVALSALAVLAAFGVLIQTWRRILATMGAHLGYRDAARIWFASNLGKYIPGNVAQLGAMAYMARQEQVSGVVASGSALLSAIVNLATGIVIALALGRRALDRLGPDYATIGVIIAAIAFLGLVLLPFVMPVLLAIAARLTRRSLGVSRVPARAVAEAILGNLIAWALYGVALQLLVPALLGGRTLGATSAYLAAYAAAYVAGYLVAWAPGGVGVRDGSIAAMLPVLVPGITAADGIALALASRVVMTILELVPGFIYLARSTRMRRRAERQGEEETLTRHGSL
jgi:uncharacterized membrane protein YbhN (UPF0104 family)